MDKILTNDLLFFENEYKLQGYKVIAGCDEAGRGPLAGPVSVACVVMPLDNIIEGVFDSKKLTERKREDLYDKIVSTALSYCIQFVDNNRIDEINILNATKECMNNAVKGLELKPDILLCDYVPFSLDINMLPIVKGDMKSYSIAAASILAKVARDRHMIKMCEEYPQYEFGKHKGYGTKLHYEKIKEFGVSEIHRKTFLKNLNEK